VLQELVRSQSEWGNKTPEDARLPEDVRLNIVMFFLCFSRFLSFENPTVFIRI